MGIRGIPLELFKDYLTDRKQRVKINNIYSDAIAVDYGIPQGSIVGPTLFLIYVNDLCQLQLMKGRIFTFADDTALVFDGESWDEVYSTAQTGFNKVSQWLSHNLLTLNVVKTKCVAFATKQNLLPSAFLSVTAHTRCPGNINCSCPFLQRVDSIKYLGVIIDQTLSFKLHIDTLTSRLRKLIYIFRTLRHIADNRIIKMVYYAMCQSLINYCITSWGGAAKSNLIVAERAQRAILKVAAGLPFRHSTADLYKKWELLTIRQTFILNTVLRQHVQLNYDPKRLNNKRRKGGVVPSQLFHSFRSHSFFCFLGPLLYNRLNSKLNIYPLANKNCKKTVINYLKSLTYEDTENLIQTYK